MAADRPTTSEETSAAPGPGASRAATATAEPAARATDAGGRAPRPAATATAGRGGRPGRPRSRLLLGEKAIVALVATLLVAELFARVVSSHLPPLLTGDSYEMQLKSERLEELAAGPAADQPEVVFLGNSMTDAGVSPETFATTSGSYDRAYNAALVGAPVGSQARWAEDFVLDGLDPEVLVLGVSPLDLLDVNPLDLLDVTSGQGRSQAVQAAFDDSLDRLRPSAGQQLEERVGDASALVEHRSSLRNPGTLGRAVSDTLSGAPPREGIPEVATVEDGEVVPRDLTFWQGNLRPTGGIQQYHDRSLAETRNPELEGRMALAAARADYRFGRLRTLLDAVTAPGREVVVAVPPIATETLASQPAAAGRLADGVAEMTTIAAEYDVEVLDLSADGYPLDAFADVAHLNRLGSERFSRELAVALDADA